MAEDTPQPDLFDPTPTETAPEAAPSAPEVTEAKPPEKMSVREALDAAVTEVRERDEKGRFAPKSADAKPDKAPAKAVEPKSSETPTERKGAPQSWSAEAKAQWDSLPPSIQAEAHRREADTAKGVQQLRSKYADLDQVFEPYRQSIQNAGRTPADVTKQLLEWNMALAQPNKAQARQAFMHLARAFGIDFTNPGSAPTAAQGGNPQGFIPPELVQHLNSLTSRVQQHEQHFASASQAAAEHTVNGWSKDKPHFPAVRQLMAHLVQTDLAAVSRGEQPIGGFVKDGQIDLDAAYNAAIYAHPETRAAVVAEETAKKAAANTAAVQRARSAAVSVRTGTPAAPSTNGKTPPRNLTVKDSIRAAIEEVRSR